MLLGNGSCGLELLEDLPDVDVVVIGVGGGGLLGGVTVALKESRPAVRVYGVEPVGSEALARGLAAGEPVPVTPVSVADGLGAPIVGRLALDVARRYLDGSLLVDDATILGGLKFALERLKQVLEPAGAAALAAVLTGAVPLRDGDRVARDPLGRQRRHRAARGAARLGRADPARHHRGHVTEPRRRHPGAARATDARVGAAALVYDGAFIGPMVPPGRPSPPAHRPARPRPSARRSSRCRSGRASSSAQRSTS